MREGHCDVDRVDSSTNNCEPFSVNGVLRNGHSPHYEDLKPQGSPNEQRQTMLRYRARVTDSNVEGGKKGVSNLTPKRGIRYL